MTHKLYVTMGQQHVHCVNTITIDKDCIMVINCNSYEEGIQQLSEWCGLIYCFTYFDKLPPGWDKYYHRGLIEVN